MPARSSRKPHRARVRATAHLFQHRCRLRQTRSRSRGDPPVRLPRPALPKQPELAEQLLVAQAGVRLDDQPVADTHHSAPWAEPFAAIACLPENHQSWIAERTVTRLPMASSRTAGQGQTLTRAIPEGMASGVPSEAYDRVLERRRAVALARHFREAEGLSITQIAARLGRSPATIKAYFYDPSDANKRPTDSPQERQFWALAGHARTSICKRLLGSRATARSRRSRLPDLSATGSATAGGAATALVLATSRRVASTGRFELGGGPIVGEMRAIRANQGRCWPRGSVSELL